MWIKQENTLTKQLTYSELWQYAWSVSSRRYRKPLWNQCIQGQISSFIDEESSITYQMVCGCNSYSQHLFLLQTGDPWIPVHQSRIAIDSRNSLIDQFHGEVSRRWTREEKRRRPNGTPKNWLIVADVRQCWHRTGHSEHRLMMQDLIDAPSDLIS